MLDPELLAILRCPVTGQPLRYATEHEKDARNIPAGEDALITVDGSRVYRASSGLPVLLPANEVSEAG